MARRLRMNHNNRKSCHDCHNTPEHDGLEVPCRVRIPVSHLSIPTARPNWQLWLQRRQQQHYDELWSSHCISAQKSPVVRKTLGPIRTSLNQLWSTAPIVVYHRPSSLITTSTRQSRTQYSAGSCNISCMMWSVGMIAGIGKVLAFA